MRLFIFAIGGTGSRVLKALAMQLAAGVRPVGPDGQPIKTLSIVPVIIDPHKGNKAVLEADTILENYQKIREQIYGNAQDDNNIPLDGFYSVKIESVANINATSEQKISNVDKGFICNLQDVSTSMFSKIVGDTEASLNQETRMLTQMLFSKGELNTRMGEGFYGQPNIGTVALYGFCRSKTFEAIAGAFTEGDRIMFIGSIFGGTGAAGMPMLALKCRQDEQHISLAKAPYGAVIVMPYFTLASDEESQIKMNDFKIKTRGALEYYTDNLNCYLHAGYYVADNARTEPIPNDPGKNGQQHNKAHIAELVCTMAIYHFLRLEFSKEDEAERNEEKNRREVRKNSRSAYEYCFNIKPEPQSSFDLTDLDSDMHDLIVEPMIRYHLLHRFVTEAFEKNLSKRFAANNKIDTNAITQAMKNFFEFYKHWIEEIGGHSAGSNFIPFMTTADEDYTDVINGIGTKKRTGWKFGNKTVNASDIVTALNSVEEKGKCETQQIGFFAMANEAFKTIVTDNYSIQDKK